MADGTEYGGKPGLIQKSEDGHVDLTAREKALLGRVWGRGGDQPAEEAIVNSGIDRATGEAWEDAAQRAVVVERNRRLGRTNGRGPEDA